ncbi:hypothetical protein BD289DRAFT_450520 [Coniella lustricola]|uniref:Uncharacterized protein n=1 Tax=Coniella lustricola TaxID=2025994 RepID=A0A2T3AI09_9PEZI|nr:hypothetical protein BD289DRAFT_450520 [Coniella lustricola]
MLFRQSTLFLLIASALGAFAALGGNVAFTAVPAGLTTAGFGGGYWFQEVDASSATITSTQLQNAASNGYKTVKANASKVKTTAYPSGVKTPPVVVALYIPGKGVIVATSIKVGAAIQSTQTCTTVLWQHRNYANCAEPNAIAIAVQQGWLTSAAGSAMPAGSMIAIYGKPGKTEGFQSPCADGTEKGDGCQKLLATYPHLTLVNPATKRAMEFVV